MSTDLNPREVEAFPSPDDAPLINPQPAANLPDRPHEPGARPTPLSRLLYP